MKDMKKIIVASDSFKGSLTSIEVANAVEIGIKNVFPQCNVIKTNVADGGEGTVSALTSGLNGRLEKAEVTGRVHVGDIMVDGLGVGDVGNIVLRDRQHLAEDGIIIVVLTLERRTNRLLAGPDIVSRGFVYVRESEQLMEDARK